MIVIMDEVIDQIRRFQKGIPVDDDHLALDVIRDAGQLDFRLAVNQTTFSFLVRRRLEMP